MSKICFNLYIGMCVFCGTGMLGTIQVAPKYPCAFVPVDHVVNQMIAVAFQLARSKVKFQVYNYNLGGDNAIKWGQFVR